MSLRTEFAQIDSFPHRVITSTIRFVVRIICDIQDQEFDKIPPYGPMIIVSNHINFLDAPIIYTHLMPRRVTALVKEETWKSPLLGFLFSLWGAIPIRRNEVDLAAIRTAKRSLDQGYFLAIAPEGTRSGDGVLQKGYSGIAVIAAYSQAPIIPIAIVGCEKFWENFKHFKRTKIHIFIGERFYINTDSKQPSRETRDQITDAIMHQIALLLPENKRGVYQAARDQSPDILFFPTQGKDEVQTSQ